MAKALKSNEGQLGIVILLFQLWLIFLTALDHLVHHTLYDFGLQFSFEWAEPYWALINLIWAFTVLLTVTAYWTGRTPTLRNKVTAFRIGFTFFGEWVGMFLDTIFFWLEGRIPAESEIWWWNPFYRLFGIQWHTSTQYTYNAIWAIILIVVWFSSALVRTKVKRLIHRNKQSGGKMALPQPSERDYRALITVVLLGLAGAVAIYGMYLGWTTIEILAIMAFFGPLLTAAITYYFVGKQAEKLHS